ncbi:golgin-45-like [Physella acuta]|uniref:golgin-45-like n=1 Tax=Physella acuta TaxID=109671 RepID=UPI0027DB3082|nr:golgin-45-like [Physella acuta]XP_059158358.1 golgin-45-like [Physella acuta]
MSSLTVKPKNSDCKETVLLRKAVPKYNFQNAQKLPKDYDKVRPVSPVTKLAEKDTDVTYTTKPTLAKTTVKPIAVVGASHLQRELPATVEEIPRDHSTATIISKQTCDTNIQPSEVSASHKFSPSPPIQSQHVPLQPSNQHSIISVPASTAITSVGHELGSQPSAEVTLLEYEKNRLKKELDIQLQVNSELKRLLVASVGEDLTQRVERLCRDHAQLSQDIGGFSKKLNEDYENLDKVSIQADMWRSKYLAARVMIEELGNARAYFSLQCHDTQDAMQQLLNERHELRTNLLEAYKVLQQVKTAFDPLNSHRSTCLRSTNVLELSRACQQLAEAMRFRLVPAHVVFNIDSELPDVWEASVTRAEQFAHEVLSRPVEPTGCLQSGSSMLLPVTGRQESLIKRFHPHTRHENLTFNCCVHCKGEISVV